MINQFTNLSNVLHRSISHLTILYLTISILSLNCKDEPTKPPVDDNKPDTTSQNFTISSWEYGDGYASAFANDVWIFDENNIWVVGLFPGFNNGRDCNIIQWNGTNWSSKTDFYRSNGITSIFALDTSTVYFTTIALYKYKNGIVKAEDMSGISFSSGQTTEKIWASSENNVWGVGANGCIVHYDGTSWKKIEFDNRFQFDAIHGSNSDGSVYALAWSSGPMIVVKLTSDAATTIFADSAEVIYDLYLETENTLLLSGPHLRRLTLDTRSIKTLYDGNGMHLVRIAYFSSNDVYFPSAQEEAGGWKPYLVHFNGSRYGTFVLPSGNSNSVRGIHVMKNLAIATCFTDNKALVITIRRSR